MLEFLRGSYPGSCSTPWTRSQQPARKASIDVARSRPYPLLGCPSTLHVSPPSSSSNISDDALHNIIPFLCTPLLAVPNSFPLFFPFFLSFPFLVFSSTTFQSTYTDRRELLSSLERYTPLLSPSSSSRCPSAFPIRPAMPFARSKDRRKRAISSKTNPAAAKTAAETAAASATFSATLSRPSSSAMSVATFQRPQPRRANSAPASTPLDADDLSKRLSMVLAQERQRQHERERKRQSWEADLIAARREQAKRPPRCQQAQQKIVAMGNTSMTQQQKRPDRPILLTAADFQDQLLPSLDEDSPLETVPPRPPVPFIWNSSGCVPVYAINSSIKLNNTSLRRTSPAEHGRSLRREAALDLETIDEVNSCVDDHKHKITNEPKTEPTAKSWQLGDISSDDSKQREQLPAGPARFNKHKTPGQPSEGEGRSRLRKLPMGERRPSQLGVAPEWSQAEEAQAEDKSQAPSSLTSLVRRGSERSQHNTWSPSVRDAMGKAGRRRSIKDRMELYCTIHPKSSHCPSTSSSSDSGRDDNHSSYSSRSWRGSFQSSKSGSRRSSILKFWDGKQSSGEKVGKGSPTDSDDSSMLMTSRQRKRSSLLSVFHL